MPIKEQVIASCAQLLGHAVRLRRSSPPLPELDHGAHRDAISRADAALLEHSASISSSSKSTPPEIPRDLFEPIEGHAGPKKLLMAALHSARPVHVLLVGPPGTGKTQFLQRIASLPGTRYATGPTISSSGLFGYLLEHPECKRLVIDELDKAAEADRYVLLTLMESGKLTRLQHKAIEDVPRTVWIFAAANSDAELEDPLRARFVRLEFRPYTEAEAVAISTRVLRREGLSSARAQEIARLVAIRSRDPRDAVQVARLVGRGGAIEPVLEQVVPLQSLSR